MDDKGRRYWTSTVGSMEIQNISMFHQVSKCIFVEGSSLLGICYFNGKNRKKNSRKLMMSLVVTHPSM